MKNIIQSLIICFSMYSTIPMPKVEWEKENMKYSFCFLPIIGLFIGLLEYFWLLFSVKYVGVFLYSAVAVVIPVIISGGIHIDGLIDTSDAIFSYGDKEKKLEILKDPHVGAFGVICCVIYFILMFGFYSELYNYYEVASSLIATFALSRATGAFITINWQSSKSSGLKHIFSEGASKNIVSFSLALWIFILFTILGFINILSFAFAITFIILFYIWFYFYSKKIFGGLTGDLIGFCICITEMILIISFILYTVLGGVFI